MPFKDPEKRRIYRRWWYSHNKESEIAHVRRRKKEIRKWLFDYKKTLKCSICSENHPAVIDFHHPSGHDGKNISQMITDGHSAKRISHELKKCKILCANCHRKLHFQNIKL